MQHVYYYYYYYYYYTRSEKISAAMQCSSEKLGRITKKQQNGTKAAYKFASVV